MMTNLTPLLSMPTKASGAQSTSTRSTEDGSGFDKALAAAESDKIARATPAPERTKSLRHSEHAEQHQGEAPAVPDSVVPTQAEQEITTSALSRGESRSSNTEIASPPIAQSDGRTQPDTSSVHTYATSADTSKSPGFTLSIDVADASAEATQLETAGAISTRTAAGSAAPTRSALSTLAAVSAPLQLRTTPAMPRSTPEQNAQSATEAHSRPETATNGSALVGTTVTYSGTPAEALPAAAVRVPAGELAPQSEPLSRSETLRLSDVSPSSSQLSAKPNPGEAGPVPPATSSFSGAPSTPSATAPIPPPATPTAHNLRPPLAPQLVPALLTVAQAGEGTHQFTVTVSPENLGPVTVRAHISGGSFHIELFSPSDIGRDAVRHILGDLRRDLAGVAPHASLNLSSGDAPTGQTGSQAFSNGSHNQQQSLDQRANPSHRDEHEDVPRESQRYGVGEDGHRREAPVPQHPLHHHNTIDVFV